MANTRALSVLIDDVREAADIEGLEDRHPDATLIKWINLAWRRLRTKVVGAGMPGLTRPSTPAALPIAPPIPSEQYLEIDWPDGAVGVYGVDVLVSTRWVPLKPMSFAQRRDFQSTGALENRPTHWLPLTLPEEDDDDVTAGKLGLFPAATGGLTYRVWYLPVWVDITDTADVFYGHDIWFEWLIQTVVRRVAQKDDDSANTLAEAKVTQAEVWAEIKRAIQNMNLAEPIRRVRANRRGQRGDSRWGD